MSGLLTGSSVSVLVEIAWNADLTDTTGAGWTWTDVTADVQQNPGISTKLGRGNEAARSQPASLTITLLNSLSAYSRGPGPNYPYVRQGVPVRVRVDPADGAGYRVVFLGFAAEWTPTWDGMGKIPLVELEAAGALRRIQQGDTPVPSAYRRSVTASTDVVAYWPMEEARGAQVSPAVRGGAPMQPTDPVQVRWGTSDDFEGSANLPDPGTAGLLAVLDPYTATGQSQTSWLVEFPETGDLVDGTVLAYVYTTGTMARWDVVYGTAAGGSLSLYRYNQDGSLNGSTLNVAFVLDDQRARLRLELTESGADVNWALRVINANPGSSSSSFSGTVVGRTFGTVSQVYLAPGGGCKGVIFGHLVVQNATTSGYDTAQALWAWQRRTGSTTGPELPDSGSVTASRIARLLGENGLALTRHTTSLSSDTVNALAEGMGPQLPQPLLELLQECETVDQGHLWDGRTAGLDYTTRRYREDGTAVLTLNAATGRLFAPFAPTDDDQRTRNKVTALRTFGASATYEDTTGPMGSRVIGTYDTKLEFNGSNDLQAIQHAAFQVSLGTVEGYRYPSITVDILGAPELAATVLALIPGDRVTITNAARALPGHPDQDVDLLVEAIAHRMAEKTWRVVLTCTWALPWLIGRVADATGDTSEFLLRADTSGSTLTALAAKGATSMSVATTTGPIWTTTADDFPMYLNVGGLRARATAAAGAASPQTFTVDPLSADVASGAAVKLWNQRPLGLGRSLTP